MLYFKCPSCGILFANKQLIYEQRMDKICGDKTLNSRQRDEAKRQVLKDLQIRDQCCVPRFLGYVRQIEIIK